HFALLDELHEHPDRSVGEMLERGFKFRQQPLLFMITNSGSDRNSFCWEEHEHAVRVVAGTKTPDDDFTYVGEVIDDTTFAYVCALDKDDDPLEDPTCWKKANPLLGTILTEEYLAEVVAQALHRWGRRAACPLVAVNCGAVPETVIESELFGHEPGSFTGAVKKRIGRMEHAHGGTLFLDEIEAMSPALQVKLLRVLEAREIAPLGTNEVRKVDIRVVAASKIDLLELVRRGGFREDLYYRLHVATVRLPPLRERRADIALLFGHFLAHSAKRFRRPVPMVTPAIRAHLATHDWPGNVRELVHYVERVALGLVEPAPAAVVAEEEAGASLPERVEAFEAAQIRDALAATRGDIQATLKRLGIPRKTLYDKLRRHGIDQSAYRQEAEPGAGRG
ncbi:MAG: hypothetical protein E2577_16595, partial [Starkeya sp.]|nr:hypothetical protein [Starkeya sp.]